MTDVTVLHVAVPVPTFGTFDYLPPRNHAGPPLCPGLRVKVGFGDRRLIGMIIGHGRHSRIPVDRLRPILKVLDKSPILSPKDLAFLRWASRYYHHALGEVINAALPKRVRQGYSALITGAPVWRISSAGRDASLELLKRAPHQSMLMALLKSHPNGLDAAQIQAELPDWRQPLAGLLKKRLVTEIPRPCLEAPEGMPITAPKLNSDQAAAVEAMLRALGGFAPFLLEGVTGSGKTEVYLKLIENVVKAGRQALVLVPEIALTPQLVARFHARFAVPLAVMHSGLSAGERHCAWHAARVGDAQIVVGTRSAVFTPLARPGIIIVDEEHDGSLKQQEGFRYHARDLAVIRASLLNIPVVLGSATPSLETLYNVERGRYRCVRLPERARQTIPPTLEILDARRCTLNDGLSSYVLEQVRWHLEIGDQVLVFLNRRGYAPTILCHDCSWTACCECCDARLTLHAATARLRCHHCGAHRPVTLRCPDCGSGQLLRLGEGTERIEQALKAAFPTTSIVRVDRDTTRRKGELQTKLIDIQRGAHQLLIGTQMLSKGHDFPAVALVVILNIDHNLYSSDFRGSERAAQLIVQVAGRAGRGERPGRVIVQTYRPDHPLLETLINKGYDAFGQMTLVERRLAGLPPYRHIALLRAEALRQDVALSFLRAAQTMLAVDGLANITALGPAPAPMERRAGRYRAQLLLIAKHRAELQRLLDDRIPKLNKLPTAHSVRWGLDVDPVDMFWFSLVLLQKASAFSLVSIAATMFYLLT